MSKSITQEMAYRQSLMKYAEKYGVSRASRKYNKSRSYIYFWRARWNGSVTSPGLPVSAASQSPQPAHRSGAEADPGYPLPQPEPWHAGVVAPAAKARLYPPPREPFQGHAQTGAVSSGREEKSIQAQALCADDLSRPAGPGRCESSAPQVYHGPGTPPVSIHCH